MIARTSSPFASFCLGFAACAILAVGIAAGPRMISPPKTEEGTSVTLSDEHTIFQTALTKADKADKDAGCMDPDLHCGGVQWEELNTSELPEDVISAANESVDGLEVTESFVAHLGSLTLYTVGGKAAGHEVSLVLTAQGTVLQADAVTPGDSIPSELADALNERFPGANITKAGITQMVTFWAHLSTEDGKSYSVSFAPEQGIAILSSESAPTSTEIPGKVTPPAQTDADPDTKPAGE